MKKSIQKSSFFWLTTLMIDLFFLRLKKKVFGMPKLWHWLAQSYKKIWLVEILDSKWTSKKTPISENFTNLEFGMNYKYIHLRSHSKVYRKVTRINRFVIHNGYNKEFNFLVTKCFLSPMNLKCTFYFYSVFIH